MIAETEEKISPKIRELLPEEVFVIKLRLWLLPSAESQARSIVRECHDWRIDGTLVTLFEVIAGRLTLVAGIGSVQCAEEVE